MRELSFPIFFFKFLNGENSGGMQSKRIYKSCKCFFKPFNTNFSKFFAQIWHKKKKKKKKNRPCFFAFYGRSGEGNITIFFFLPYEYYTHALTCLCTQRGHKLFDTHTTYMYIHNFWPNSDLFQGTKMFTLQDQSWDMGHFKSNLNHVNHLYHTMDRLNCDSH